MQGIRTNLERDAEVRTFKAHGRVEIASAGAATMARGTFEPGWKWSTDVAPIAGTSSCLTRHLGFVLSGGMHIVCDDGAELDIGPGDLFDLPSGHDAWVTSDEPCVMIDVSPDVISYARGPVQAVAAQEDRNVHLVREGYAAFNSADVDTLRRILANDVVVHVPGSGPFAGEHKGFDSVMAYYGGLAETTGGTLRADLIEAHGDGHGHVVAVHQVTATRNGITRVSRGSLVFTFIGGKATDVLELNADQAGNDAFFA